MNVLFLDDNPNRTKSFRSQVPYAKCVQTSQQCIEQLERQKWDVVFLDHDLGDETYVDSSREDCGMEVVRWVAQNYPKINEFVIHSHNGPASQEMSLKLRDAGYHTTILPFAMFPQTNLYQSLKVHT